MPTYDRAYENRKRKSKDNVFIILIISLGHSCSNNMSHII